MYLECVFSPWGARSRSRDFPVDVHQGEGFSRWVEHFLQGDWRGHGSDFQCYNPYNLEARALTCNRTKFGASHHLAPDQPQNPQLSKAASGLREIDVLIVTDLFVESACILFYRLKGSLPKSCDCRAEHFGIGIELPHAMHKLPKHSLATFPVSPEIWPR